VDGGEVNVSNLTGDKLGILKSLMHEHDRVALMIHTAVL